MDSSLVGAFIKQLRENKKMSQEELASKANCDRTKINKIENGKRNIQTDDLIIFSEIFNISIEELIAGEFKKSKNEEKIEITLKDYLKSQNTKQKKFKILIAILIFALILLILAFSIIYFFQNYNSIKIYEISGNSKNYEITDGLLVLTKDKIYFKLGNIEPEVESVSIYSVINDKKELIYEGKSDEILYDFYGYNSLISYKDFIKSNQTLYVKIDDEEIRLNFQEDFSNKEILYKKKDQVSTSNKNKESMDIPKNIKESFTCEAYQCNLATENEIMTYNSDLFSITVDNELYEYYIENSILTYQSISDIDNIYTWKIENNEAKCISNNCDDVYEKYKKFYNNYFLKYLN